MIRRIDVPTDGRAPLGGRGSTDATTAIVRSSLGTVRAGGRASPPRSSLVALALLAATGAHAADPPSVALPDAPWRSITLAVENDLFVGADDGYTSGVGLIDASGPFARFEGDRVPRWLAALAGVAGMNGDDSRHRARVFDIAQTLQTPGDITAEKPRPGELPWAATLLLGTTLYAFDTRRSDRLRLSAGVVGPLALGEASQTLVHDLIGSDEPRGWDNQLDDEAVFLAEASRSVRWFTRDSDSTLDVDSIVLGGVGLGNLRTYASASLVARVGRGLERTHAVASLLPGRQANPTVFSGGTDWYAFTGAQFEYVAKDLLVEGTDFSSGPSAPLDRTRPRVAAGFSGALGAFGVTLLYAGFPGNGGRDAFGSLSVTWRYR